MGDVDEGDAQLLLQALEFKLHLAAELQIQRAQRFIQQQQLRFGRERAGDGDALESWLGMRLAKSAICTSSSISRTRFSMEALSILRTRRP